MSISIVNGYVCASCADVAKARRGENPAKSDDVATASPTRLAEARKAAEERSAGSAGIATGTPASASDPGTVNQVGASAGTGRLDIRV